MDDSQPNKDDNLSIEDDCTPVMEADLQDVGSSVEEIFNYGLGLKKGYAVVAPYGGG